MTSVKNSPANRPPLKRDSNPAYKELDKTHRDLTEAEELYRSLLNSNADAFVIYDMQGCVQYMNDAFTEIFGWQREELMGHPTPFVPENQKKQADEQRQMLFTGETGRVVFETQRLTKDNRILDVRISGSCYYDRNGNLAGMLSILNNITRRKKAEKALANSERKLKKLSAQILLAQESERKLVAQDLHDGIQQSLTGIKYKLENALAQMAFDESGPVASLKQIVPLLQNAIDDIHKITMNLRPAMLDDLGLIATIEWFCQEFHLTHPDIFIESDITLYEHEIQEDSKIVIFRIIQEAFNNIAKHSDADHVRITLSVRNQHIDLMIKDNGIGFGHDLLISEEGCKRGLGLSSMQERATLSGGMLCFSTGTGKGFLVRASWPLGDGISTGSQDLHESNT